MSRRVASCEECGWIADASLVEFSKCPRSCATELRYYPVQSVEAVMVDRDGLTDTIQRVVYGTVARTLSDERQVCADAADAVLALLNGGAA